MRNGGDLGNRRYIYGMDRCEAAMGDMRWSAVVKRGRYDICGGSESVDRGRSWDAAWMRGRCGGDAREGGMQAT